MNNPDYICKPDIIKANLKDYKRIYEYYPLNTVVNLVPEPNNEHDPNAIKVMVGKNHLGYIPASECLRIKKIMGKLYFTAVAYIHNGNSLLYCPNGDIVSEEHDISIDLNIYY